MELFNDTGAPIDPTFQDVTNHIGRIARAEIARLFADGCSAVEIRAAAAWMGGEIAVTAAELIIKYGLEKRKAEREAVPPTV